MDIVKPEPLILDGVPHYTLSSYDPVSIEVQVSTVAEKDVENMAALTIIQHGGGLDQLSDDAWISQNIEGVRDANDLREQARQQLNMMNEQISEQQKRTECGMALAKRLQQRIPQEYLEYARASVEEIFNKTLHDTGFTMEQYLMQAGKSKADIEAMFAEQARTNVECEAAVSAWADHRKITVSEEELPTLLGIPAEMYEETKAQLEAAGRFESTLAYARQAKALELIVSECHCTYKHATPEDDGPKLKLV